MSKHSCLKLNIGCGSDYRNGFVNTDGSESICKVDKVIRIPEESLLDFYALQSCDYILAQDVVEHLFRWEAIRILQDFHSLLALDGILQVMVHDIEYIVRTWSLPIERKILLLYGGQDVSQNGPLDMETSRRNRPDLFCHKYGGTRKSLGGELISLGFSILENHGMGTNFVIKALKKLA